MFPDNEFAIFEEDQIVERIVSNFDDERCLADSF